MECLALNTSNINLDFFIISWENILWHQLVREATGTMLLSGYDLIMVVNRDPIQKSGSPSDMDVQMYMKALCPD